MHAVFTQLYASGSQLNKDEYKQINVRFSFLIFIAAQSYDFANISEGLKTWCNNIISRLGTHKHTLIHACIYVHTQIGDNSYFMLHT